MKGGSPGDRDVVVRADGVGQGCQTRVIQPGGLSAHSAYHQIEELVFTEARCLCCREIRVCDLRRPRSDFAEQPIQRWDRPALLNTRARCSGDALLSPFRMRSCRAR